MPTQIPGLMPYPMSGAAWAGQILSETPQSFLQGADVARTLYEDKRKRAQENLAATTALYESEMKKGEVSPATIQLAANALTNWSKINQLPMSPADAQKVFDIGYEEPGLLGRMYGETGEKVMKSTMVGYKKNSIPVTGAQMTKLFGQPQINLQGETFDFTKDPQKIYVIPEDVWKMYSQEQDLARKKLKDWLTNQRGKADNLTKIFMTYQQLMFKDPATSMMYQNFAKSNPELAKQYAYAEQTYNQMLPLVAAQLGMSDIEVKRLGWRSDEYVDNSVIQKYANPTNDPKGFELFLKTVGDTLNKGMSMINRPPEATAPSVPANAPAAAKPEMVTVYPVEDVYDSHNKGKVLYKKGQQMTIPKSTYNTYKNKFSLTQPLPDLKR